ncbi:MAG: hypothetical protein GWN79_13755, partial [Actinobacteria bacterium]|nr:hypothetical protein [Actinomycetota bacterium]NIS32645.1 hypothetical protein [Actinomycetota bacterium]NIT96388.1 hypothetical protein [Actinomycetota bacterium]NIU20088.1 hypothetical protein [Actinomycetota bacterium]NIU67651.1 hypothetical protein [Actinomycetota bacterium]
FRAWGIGKLVVVGVVAWGLMSLTLVDFGDGSPLWDQHYEGTELVARWLLIGSAGVVLIGV